MIPQTQLAAEQSGWRLAVVTQWVFRYLAPAEALVGSACYWILAAGPSAEERVDFAPVGVCAAVRCLLADHMAMRNPLSVGQQSSPMLKGQQGVSVAGSARHGGLG